MSQAGMAASTVLEKCCFSPKNVLEFYFELSIITLNHALYWYTDFRHASRHLSDSRQPARGGRQGDIYREDTGEDEQVREWLVPGGEQQPVSAVPRQQHPRYVFLFFPFLRVSSCWVRLALSYAPQFLSVFVVPGVQLSADASWQTKCSARSCSGFILLITKAKFIRLVCNGSTFVSKRTIKWKRKVGKPTNEN